MRFNWWRKPKPICGQDPVQWIASHELVDALAKMRRESKRSLFYMAERMGCSYSHARRMEHRSDSILRVGDVQKWVNACGKTLRWTIYEKDA